MSVTSMIDTNPAAAERVVGFKGRWPLARLVLGHVCLHASMAAMRLAAPLYALRQGESAMAVGVLLALFALTQVFLSIPAGHYADRHGLRRPIGGAVVVASLGSASAFIFPSMATLALAALCLGGAMGISAIALQRHVGRMARDTTELKQAFSLLSIGPALSNFLGPVAAGLLIDYASVPLGGASGDVTGFRAAFLLSTLLPLGTWFWIRNAHELPASPHPVGSAREQVMQVLQAAPMRRLLLVNWLLSSCWDVHTFVVPVLGHERGFSASVIGTILGGFAVAAVAVRLVLPALAERLREWVVISGAMLCTAVLFGVYPFMQAPWTMGLCSVLLGVALGTVQPMVMSTLHQITPDHLHGQAIAVRLMAINLSSVFMPMLFGSAGALVGVSVVFWTVGAMVGVGSRLAWRLRP
jgi:MFS family permease